jgi:hypothetical protein
MSRIAAVFLLAALLSGCMATSGREWLNSPIEERAAPAATDLAGVEATTPARPRLSHTVTLGETYASAPEPALGGVARGAPVQVNVQTHVPVVVNNWGGYGYGYGYPTGVGNVSAPARTARASNAAQQVGADFPAVPDYGPPAMR